MTEDLKYMFENHYKGFRHRVTKQQLMDQYGIKDERIIRRAIEQLRDQGMLIVSTSASKGYWLTTNELLSTDILERCCAELMVAEFKSRIRKISNRTTAIRKTLAQINSKQILMTY